MAETHREGVPVSQFISALIYLKCLLKNQLGKLSKYLFKKKKTYLFI